MQLISKDNTTIANSFFASGNRYSTRFCFSISSQGDKKRRDFIRNITYVPKLDIFISSSEKGVVSQWSSKVQTVYLSKCFGIWHVFFNFVIKILGFIFTVSLASLCWYKCKIKIFVLYWSHQFLTSFSEAYISLSLSSFQFKDTSWITGCDYCPGLRKIIVSIRRGLKISSEPGNLLI
jgi:hypothetical protein